MAGNTEMANGSFDPIASHARLSERVEGQGKDIVDLRSNMNTGFQQINANIASLANETRTAIANLTTTIGERSKPNIQAYGFMLSVALAVGALAYWPIRESTNYLKTAVLAVSENMVSRQEMDWRAERGAEDRARQEEAIKSIRTEQVPRDELDRVWLSYDQRFSDIQRQIDEGNARFAETYTPGDYLKRMTERMDMLEQRLMSRP